MQFSLATGYILPTVSLLPQRGSHFGFIVRGLANLDWKYITLKIGLCLLYSITAYESALVYRGAEKWLVSRGFTLYVWMLWHKLKQDIALNGFQPLSLQSYLNKYWFAKKNKKNAKTYSIFSFSNIGQVYKAWICTERLISLRKQNLLFLL